MPEKRRPKSYSRRKESKILRTSSEEGQSPLEVAQGTHLGGSARKNQIMKKVQWQHKLQGHSGNPAHHKTVELPSPLAIHVRSKAFK